MGNFRVWSCGLVLLAGVLASAPAAARRGAAEALPFDVRLQTAGDAEGDGIPMLAPPIPGAPVTSSFGWRRNPVLKHRRFHAGIDFGAAVGAPVAAAADGVVEEIGMASDLGRYVVIRHDARLSTRYGHLSAVAPGLQVGEAVAVGGRIGAVGRSGWTSGPNLHFEVVLDGYRIDPELHLQLPALLPVAGLGAARRYNDVQIVGRGNASRIATFFDH